MIRSHVYVENGKAEKCFFKQPTTNQQTKNLQECTKAFVLILDRIYFRISPQRGILYETRVSWYSERLMIYIHLIRGKSLEIHSIRNTADYGKYELNLKGSEN